MAPGFAASSSISRRPRWPPLDLPEYVVALRKAGVPQAAAHIQALRLLFSAGKGAAGDKP